MLRFAFWIAPNSIALPTSASSLTVTEFGQSTPTIIDGNKVTPGAIAPFAFSFNVTAVNGVIHSGTASGTWRNNVSCGGKRLRMALCANHDLLRNGQ
jgi:hypothetical protein